MENKFLGKGLEPELRLDADRGMMLSPQGPRQRGAGAGLAPGD